jgi:hypothetical protein
MNPLEPDPLRDRLRRFEFATPSPRLRERIVSLATPGAPWGAILAAAAALLIAALGDSFLIAPRMARLVAPPNARPAIPHGFETPSTRLLAAVGAPPSMESLRHPLMLELARGERR